MFSCCFKKKNYHHLVELNSRQIQAQSSGEFPDIVYVAMAHNLKNTNPSTSDLCKNVFESELDCQQYCIDNNAAYPLDYNFYYITDKYIPPSSDTWFGYPKYSYPMFYTNNYGEEPLKPTIYCFAAELDASAYVREHSNEDVLFMYSNMYFIPTGTYDYKIHGYVGHQFFKTQPNLRVVNPMQAMMIR